MAEFHPEPRELGGTEGPASSRRERRRRREGVDDEPTPVAGVVIMLLGIRSFLDGTVDTDRVCHPFVFPPRMRLAHL
jgi:hypothetical protein